MKKFSTKTLIIFTSIFFLSILSSCAFMVSPKILTQEFLPMIHDWQERVKSEMWVDIPENLQSETYKINERQIKNWEKKIKKDGWSIRLIHEIYWDSIHLADYDYDSSDINNGDYWFTPKEFIENDFHGDCEDISVFIWSIFKKLKYPHQIRIRIVMGTIGGHALIMIELPNGEWKQFESVLLNIPGGEFIWYRGTCEFDEKNIYFIEEKVEEVIGR
jgi:hypothetical protein